MTRYILFVSLLFFCVGCGPGDQGKPENAGSGTEPAASFDAAGAIEAAKLDIEAGKLEDAENTLATVLGNEGVSDTDRKRAKALQLYLESKKKDAEAEALFQSAHTALEQGELAEAAILLGEYQLHPRASETRDSEAQTILQEIEFVTDQEGLRAMLAKVSDSVLEEAIEGEWRTPLTNPHLVEILRDKARAIALEHKAARDRAAAGRKKEQQRAVVATLDFVRQLESLAGSEAAVARSVSAETVANIREALVTWKEYSDLRAESGFIRSGRKTPRIDQRKAQLKRLRTAAETRLSKTEGTARKSYEDLLSVRSQIMALSPPLIAPPRVRQELSKLVVELEALAGEHLDAAKGFTNLSAEQFPVLADDAGGLSALAARAPAGPPLDTLLDSYADAQEVLARSRKAFTADLDSTKKRLNSLNWTESVVTGEEIARLRQRQIQLNEFRNRFKKILEKEETVRKPFVASMNDFAENDARHRKKAKTAQAELLADRAEQILLSSAAKLRTLYQTTQAEAGYHVRTLMTFGKDNEHEITQLTSVAPAAADTALVRNSLQRLAELLRHDLQAAVDWSAAIDSAVKGAEAGETGVVHAKVAVLLRNLGRDLAEKTKKKREDLEASLPEFTADGLRVFYPLKEYKLPPLKKREPDPLDGLRSLRVP